MDSNLLKVFVAVANKKSISLGANELGFAQSNVTSRIKQVTIATKAYPLTLHQNTVELTGNQSVINI